MTQSSKPLCSLSLDLDNMWSYMKIHGDKGWEDFPSYFDIFVPHVLKALDDLELNITFFIVGQDAALKKNHLWLKMIIDHGHEIGNHSFKHESWLHAYSREQIEKEIERAEEMLFYVVGQRTRGFRGPGFSWSPDLLEVLHERGYLFDASTLPTYIGPLARMYYFWTANLSKEGRKERKKLFGSFKDGLRPVKAYYWKLREDKKLLEIPVTTIPGIKMPFHLSYLLYLTSYSVPLMKFYLKTAISLCKVTGTEPSFLLHPLDLIGGDQLQDLAFFPGMNVSSAKKIDVFNMVIKELKNNFDIVSMTTQASNIIKHKSCISINLRRNAN